MKTVEVVRPPHMKGAARLPDAHLALMALTFARSVGAEQIRIDGVCYAVAEVEALARREPLLWRTVQNLGNAEPLPGVLNAPTGQYKIVQRAKQ